MEMDRFGSVADRVAFWFEAKNRPEDVFGAAFQDLRERAKALKEKWSQEAKDHLSTMLRKDLEEMGLRVESVDVSLGKYKGSRFVTSAKVRVEVPSEAKAKGLAEYLLRYSPKYLLKFWDSETKMAEYNIR
jgi:hypothetical protein